MHIPAFLHKYLLFGLLLAVAALTECTDWPTRFERIDYDRPRVLDFVYKNLSDTTLCEAAPGDSVLLIAYLAGIESYNIEWKVSFNTIINQYFEDTAKDIQPLEYISVVPDTAGFSDSTYIVAIKFKVPDSIFHINESLDEGLIAQSGMSKETLLDLVDLLATSDPAQMLADSSFMALISELQSGAAGDSVPLDVNFFLQALTIPVRIFATINGVYKTQSDFTVRYNRRLQDTTIAALLGDVNVNHNPMINFVGIHKARMPVGPKFSVGTMTESDTTYCLFVRDSLDVSMAGPAYVTVDSMAAREWRIGIDTGYAYFLAVDSGVVHGVDMRDQGITLKGTMEPENYYTQWFYRHDRTEMDAVSHSDLMIIGSGDPVEELLPPLDPLVTGATIWVQVYDQFLGEILRPFGSTLAEVKVSFDYSQAYIDANSSGEGLVRF